MSTSNSVPLPIWPDILWGGIGIMVLVAIIWAAVLIVRRGRE